MKSFRSIMNAGILVLVLAGLTTTDVQAGSAGYAFTYQGQLKDGGAPYDGLARFEFSLWDSERDGREVATPVNLDLDVVNGLFNAPLDFARHRVQSFAFHGRPILAVRTDNVAAPHQTVCYEQVRRMGDPGPGDPWSGP